MNFKAQVKCAQSRKERMPNWLPHVGCYVLVLYRGEATVARIQHAFTGRTRSWHVGDDIHGLEHLYPVNRLLRALTD